MRGLFVIFVILIAIAALFFFSKSRAPDMLSANLSKKLGVPVSIESINFGISDTEVKNIEIGNPSGYNLSKAFSADEIEISAPATELLKKHIIIDLIEVDNIYLGIEFDTKTSTSGNWTKIFSSFQKRANLNKTTGKEVLIKKLIFKNIRSEIFFRDGGSTKELPIIQRIELTNISTQGGVPTDQLMGTVLAQMLREVFIQQNINNMLKGIFLDTPSKAVDKFLKPFKGFFNAVKREDFETSA